VGQVPFDVIHRRSFAPEIPLHPSDQNDEPDEKVADFIKDLRKRPGKDARQARFMK